MPPSYKADPPPDPTTSPGLTNTHVQGMLWRETWAEIDLNGQGQHDWSYLDAAFGASDGHAKLSSLQVLAGTYSPSWFFALPGAKHLDVAGVGPTTVPWDPVFQRVWEELNAAMATRYDGNPNLKYVVIAGPGHSSESFFANTAEDQAAADVLAQSMGYPDAVTAWKAGVTRLIDMYARHWTKTPFVLVTGTPFFTGGTEALQAMYDYGDAHYRGRFGARADDLTSGSPTPTEPSATIIEGLSPNSSAVGYQFGNHQNVNDPNPPTRLGQALQRGIGYGAHYIEVFADDADDPVSAHVLDAAAAQLLAP